MTAPMFTVDLMPAASGGMHHIMDGSHPVGKVLPPYADALRAALEVPDLTASTPTVDGPEGLTGPSAEGTWYGPLRCVPEGWDYRGHEEGEWMVPAGRRLGTIVEARPVPLPVTEEVAWHEAQGRIHAESGLLITSVAYEGVVPIARHDVGHSHVSFCLPSGMVTVQREGDEK